jgi:hypothetical protein
MAAIEQNTRDRINRLSDRWSPGTPTSIQSRTHAIDLRNVFRCARAGVW